MYGANIKLRRTGEGSSDILFVLLEGSRVFSERLTESRDSGLSQLVTVLVTYFCQSFCL